MKEGRFWKEEEAVAAMLAVDLKPLAPFVRAQAKWDCVCLVCGEEQKLTLHLVTLNGYGCGYCAGKLDVIAALTTVCDNLYRTMNVAVQHAMPKVFRMKQAEMYNLKRIISLNSQVEDDVPF